MKKTFLIGLVLILAATLGMQAQVMKINPQSSNIKVEGTSDKGHHWEMNTKNVNGEMTLVNMQELKTLKVNMKVESLESTKSVFSGGSVMNNLTYKTFNSDKNPNISFVLTEVSSFQNSGKNIKAVIKGKLSMGGGEKIVVLNAIGTENKPGSLEFKGKVELKMSDFKMKAPEISMLNTKVSDLVNLNFDIVLNEQGSAAK